MSLKQRLHRLEQGQTDGPSLTSEEGLNRLTALLDYPGVDPVVIARKSRVAELLQLARERMQKAMAR